MVHGKNFTNTTFSFIKCVKYASMHKNHIKKVIHDHVALHYYPCHNMAHYIKAHDSLRC